MGLHMIMKCDNTAQPSVITHTISYDMKMTAMHFLEELAVIRS